MSTYLVDNSAWANLILGSPAVVQRINEIRDSPADYFGTCPPQVLEFCHSAPPGQHAAYRDAIRLGFPLEHHPDEALVLDIQAALWGNGLFRAAGAMDILIAAYAIVNDATVLACDQDFGHIARVTPSFSFEYVSPERPTPPRARAATP